MRFSVLLMIWVVVGQTAVVVGQIAEKKCLISFINCYCKNIISPVASYRVFKEMKVDNDTGEESCMPTYYVPLRCRQWNCTIIPDDNFLELYGDTEDYKLDMAGKLTLPEGAYAHLPPRLTQRKKKEFLKIFDVLPKSLVVRNPSQRIETPCQIPEHTSNSIMKFYVYPSSVTGSIYCLHGYGLNYGTKTVTYLQNFHCDFTEKVWKPYDLEDCKPFDNCRGTLKRPGTLRCIKAEVNEAVPFCEIYCERHENFPEVPLANYSCGERSRIPHCADIEDIVTID